MSGIEKDKGPPLDEKNKQENVEKEESKQNAAEQENTENNSDLSNDAALAKKARNKRIRRIIAFSILGSLAVAIGVLGANILLIMDDPMRAFDQAFDTGMRGDSDPLPGNDMMTPDGYGGDDYDDWDEEEYDEWKYFDDDVEEGASENGLGIESNGENSGNEAFLSPSPQPKPSAGVDPQSQLIKQSDPDFMKNRINILILGLDKSPERSKSSNFRSDTMLLMSVDFEDESVDLVSIPRDSYVEIYNRKYYNKANIAFQTGGGMKYKDRGYEYAAKTVSSLFGNIPIHYTVGFDMSVVKDIVDALGGIDYNVDIDVKMNGRSISAGDQHLDGQAVLDYSRMLEKNTDDISRIRRQQGVFLAIGEEIRDTVQWVKIPAIFQSMRSKIDTELGIRQVSSLALLASRISPEKINCYVIPGENVKVNGVSYWGIDHGEHNALLQNLFDVEAKLDRKTDLQYLKSNKSKKNSSGKSSSKSKSSDRSNQAKPSAVPTFEQDSYEVAIPDADGMIDLQDIPEALY